MFCEKCGNELPEGVRYCSKCGTRVTDAGRETEQTAAREGRQGGRGRGGVPAAAWILLAVGIGAGAAALGKHLLLGGGRNQVDQAVTVAYEPRRQEEGTSGREKENASGAGGAAGAAAGEAAGAGGAAGVAAGEAGGAAGAAAGEAAGAGGAAGVAAGEAGGAAGIAAGEGRGSAGAAAGESGGAAGIAAGEAADAAGVAAGESGGAAGIAAGEIAGTAGERSGRVGTAGQKTDPLGETYIEFEPAQGNSQAVMADAPFVLPGSDSRYIDVRELENFTVEQCRLARNEIYARHGRRFNDEELQAYFDAQDWYVGTVAPENFREAVLNEYELYNRDLIVRYEEQRGYR